jgi:cytochrome c
MKHEWKSGLSGLALALCATPGLAALTYPGCADLKASDFTMVPLINNAMDNSVQEPIKMAFDMDEAGNVDIYFTQRFGKIRKYDGAKKSMVTIADFAFTEAQVPAPPDRNSAGVNGIALDPGFKTNHWLYLFIGLSNDWRISRFVVIGDKMDLASEKPIFRFNGGGKATTHVAGALRFDDAGNLWVTVTENEAATPSANTNSYLGKILRIKPKPFPDDGPAPTPGVGGTYDIPAGNLYPAGTEKTLPEIYIMGVRNPYTIALDPVRKGVAWGDVGPDGVGVTEEFNFATEPGNYGYPTFAGAQKQLRTGNGTPAAPLNNYPDNTGLTALKPAITATLAYGQACAITGPIYYYDRSLTSPYKLPPHLNGAWLITDFNNVFGIDALELDKAGTKILSRLSLLPAGASGQLNAPGEIQVGPDGVLYVMNYSGFRSWNAKTGLLRIEYHGNCVGATTMAPFGFAKIGASFEVGALTINAVGGHEVYVWSASGKSELHRTGSGPARYDFRSDLGPGLHILKVKTSKGTFDFKFVR